MKLNYITYYTYSNYNTYSETFIREVDGNLEVETTYYNGSVIKKSNVDWATLRRLNDCIILSKKFPNEFHSESTEDDLKNLISRLNEHTINDLIDTILNEKNLVEIGQLIMRCIKETQPIEVYSDKIREVFEFLIK